MEETGLGALEHAEVVQTVAKATNTSNRSSVYTKYTAVQRYRIGKYASEYGSTNAVRKFQKDFPSLKESTVGEFRKKYQKMLKENKNENQSPKKALELEKQGRPLMLGNVHEKARFHIILSKVRNRFWLFSFKLNAKWLKRLNTKTSMRIHFC